MNENKNKYVDINAHDNYPDSKQKIEVPTMKVIPLKKICMTIGELPTSYLETMTYYEMLIWFINYLRDNIIPAVNNNASAVQEVQTVVMELQNYINSYKDSIDSNVEELEEYMNNYFENLDVQEEINNKLDKMLENGDLEQIIEQFLQSTAVWCFDNVSDMKNATNLTNGSYTKTLGYYNKNDNGGAIYKIREKLSGETPDESFVIAINNPNLVAEIVLDNVININSMGADSTGVTDSSTIFNKAFEYINNKWLSGDYNINTIETNGKYLWNNQVKMPPCARLRGSGYTTILTNVTGSALLIDYLSSDFPTKFDGNKQDWLFAELINFEKGGLFKNVGTNLTNIGVEIGRNSEIITPSGNLAYCRFKLCNFRIYNYDVALLHNTKHVFIAKYDNVSFETNNTGVQFGASTSVTSVDSGENITFINCLFASGTNGIVWNVAGWDVSVITSSFDFLTNCIVKNANGYSKFSASNSHFEGFTYLMKGFKNNDVLSIEQSTLMFARNGDIFDSISTGEGAAYISLFNNKLMPIDTPTDPTKCISTSDISLVYGFNFVGNDVNFYGFKPSNIVSNFDSLNDGSVSVSDNAEIGIWKVVTGGDYTGTIVTDNYLYEGHKSLVLTSTVDTAAEKNFGITTKEFIPISSLKGCLFGDIFKYNMQGGGSFTYYFYDENKQEISHTSGYHYLAGASEQNTWYIPSNGVRAYIPANAKYFKVAVSMSNINNSTADPIGTDYKIGGIIIN